MTQALGMTQALLSRTIPVDARDDLEVVRESGTGLVALISDLLDLTRAEVGKLELHEAPVDLFRLARSVAALYRRPLFDGWRALSRPRDSRRSRTSRSTHRRSSRR